MAYLYVSPVEAVGRSPLVAADTMSAASGRGAGAALVFSRSFEALTNTFVLAVWPFYALTITAIYRLRVRRPDLPRPYRTLGDPVVPAVFIGSVVWFVANALIYSPVPSLTTFGVILAGLSVYYVFSRDRVRFR